MNCLEFRRLKLADPRQLPEAARLHAHGCADCTAFALSVDAKDAEMLRALSVPVPDGLADRVLLRRERGKRPAWRAWALAASIFLVIGSTAAYFAYAPSEAYARYAIAHVLHEPESLTTEYHADPRSVASALQTVGASIRSPVGKVRYVKLCPWEDGGTAWHIVFDTPQGLATLIVVPGAQPRFGSNTTANGLSARVQPFRRGFFAVVTSSPEATDRIADIVRARIDWNA